MGAFMTDSHDSAICRNGKYGGLSKSVLAKKIITTNPVNHMMVGVYTVKYNGKDFQGLAANQKTRKVTVVDTTKPVLTVCTGGAHAWKRFSNKGAQWSHNNQAGTRPMKIQAGQHARHQNMDFNGKHGCQDHHVIQHSAGYTKDIAVISNLMKASKSSTCTDTCTSTKTSTSMHKGSCKGPQITFNTLKPASYFVKYHCADKNGNTQTKCRTVVNEDHAKPVLDILGNDLMTIEATYHKNYVDDGATCSDQVDDVISQQVEVSGDVVNLSKIGTYKITYKCKDTAGNAADPLTRTVVVKDTTCPTCKLNGGKKTQKVVREASFPHGDLGATCTDNIDGARPTKRTGTFNVETTGTYSSLTPPLTSLATPSARASASTPPAAPSSSRTRSSPSSPSTSVARRSTSPVPTTRVSTARPTRPSSPATTLTSWKRPRPPSTDGSWVPSPLPSPASLSLATP